MTGHEERDLRRPDHLPNLRPGKEPLDPSWLPLQRRGTTPQMIGRYPDYDVMANAENWDEATRAVVMSRLEKSGPLRFFTAEEEGILRAFCDVTTGHLVGGARMGARPEESVVDSDHRVWGVPNLFVADGSVCPTQGSANPALTIMALASRLAERLANRSMP